MNRLDAEYDSMSLGNDARGWIMTAISGVACVLGASIICADIIVRKFPGMKDFRIQDSDAFLSASLSLSFGVMLFSALYKMLPSSKHSLNDGGLSPKAAAWVLVACFMAGALGIQVVSRILHHYIPSHIVDCEHTHDEENQKEVRPKQSHRRMRLHSRKSSRRSDNWPPPTDPTNGESNHPASSGRSRSATQDGKVQTLKPQRPTLNTRISRTLSKLSTTPANGCKCSTKGPCRGFTDPCSQECFKIVQTRSSFHNHSPIHPTGQRQRVGDHTFEPPVSEATPLISGTSTVRDRSADASGAVETSDDEEDYMTINHSSADASNLTPYEHAVQHRHKTSMDSAGTHEQHPQHHHHVPTNAFLSIGLQTSIAIALHKLPEGFITYATNHANPTLGFSVFLALFVHNITEGFAMALPLYLAIQSRWKAMFWSSILGGFSQPLGAGVAAIWFKLAGSGDHAPGEGVYGGMFAVTSGIMTSVALQLFSESLDLTHNRNLCMGFAFVGMGIMGISSALTAE